MCLRSLEKYVAGSTEDLARLFSLEKDLWKLIKGHVKADKEGIRGGVKLTDWKRVLEEDDLTHVSNPIAAFQVDTRKVPFRPGLRNRDSIKH